MREAELSGAGGRERGEGDLKDALGRRKVEEEGKFFWRPLSSAPASRKEEKVFSPPPFPPSTSWQKSEKEEDTSFPKKSFGGACCFFYFLYFLPVHYSGKRRIFSVLKKEDFREKRVGREIKAGWKKAFSHKKGRPKKFLFPFSLICYACKKRCVSDLLRG